MYVEKRNDNSHVKYYLVHSYRAGGVVKKIRRYLGKDLSDKELSKRRIEVEKVIFGLLDDLNTEVFLFSLSPNQVKSLNSYSDQIDVVHFDKSDWLNFKESFVFNTNAIEGSHVKEEDVKLILDKKRVSSLDEIEIKGVALAVEFIKSTKEDLSVDFIRKLHKLCFDGSKSFAGQFRSVEVVIRNSEGVIVHEGVPVRTLGFALNDLVEWYHENRSKFKPLVLAAIIHNQFEYIHPFQDGNGRVGRLLLNFILFKNNYPPINILLKDRFEYYRTLQAYDSNQDLKPTLKFLVKQYDKTIRQVTTR